MEKKSCDKCIRWICGALFAAFAFCWLCFFQGNYLYALVQGLFHHKDWAVSGWLHVVAPIVLTVLTILIEMPVARLFRFKDGLYACNYLPSAFLLGVVTCFDGLYCTHELSVPSFSVWIVSVTFSVALFFICRIVSAVPKSGYNVRPRILAGNLLIMSLLFCLTAYLGNTDENLHRSLMINRYVSRGQYEKALCVGMFEEEADCAVVNARLEAMLRLDASDPGSGIGEYLFNYPIYREDLALDYLHVCLGSTEYDSHSIQIAMAMISRNLQKADALITPYIYKGQVPKYYMQLLALTGNSQAQSSFPQEYAAQKQILDSFTAQLESLSGKPEKYRANSTYIEYHNTYYWYYTFRRQ